MTVFNRLPCPHYLLLSIALFLLLLGCKEETAIYKKLQDIDTLLLVSPAQALDTLQRIDTRPLGSKEKAYYGLLLTIAQHKNHIPFSNDSIISASREWYIKGDNNFNLARSEFYYGLVINDVSSSKEKAVLHMLEALQILDSSGIQNSRLEALICAYIGQLNDSFIEDYAEAAKYYRRAVALETNSRNLIIDYCSLLVCLVKDHNHIEADWAKYGLDSCLSDHPDIKISKVNNAKAIYYLYSRSNLDSAWIYTTLWNPPTVDYGAKMGLLSEIAEKKGQLDSAIIYEKKAFQYRRTADSLLQYIYYKRLSDLYNQKYALDSSSHYARLAYQELRENLNRLSDRKVLELEKKYDLAKKEAELVRVRRDKDIVLIGLFISVLVALLLATLYYLNRLRTQAQRRALEAERQLKQQLQERNQIEIAIANRNLTSEKQLREILLELSKTRNVTISKLTPILNKAYGEKSSVSKDLEILMSSLTGDHTAKITTILESDLAHQKPILKEVANILSGLQMRAVFILTEYGCTTAEIKEYLCTTASSVRATKSNIRQKILASNLAHLPEILDLRILLKKD